MQSNAAVKVPTAPWMKGPLLLQPSEVIDLSKPRKKKDYDNATEVRYNKSLTEKVSGGRGKRAMKIVVRSIEKLQELHNSDHSQEKPGQFPFGVSLDLFNERENSKSERKLPWSRADKVVFRRVKKEKVVTVAELSLPKELFERLRSEAVRMRKWVKVKKAGITQNVIDEINSIWKYNELALMKFDMPLCRNMDRAQKIAEIKTGGLVVWSKKDTLVIYRGLNYQSTPKMFPPQVHNKKSIVCSKRNNNVDKLALPSEKCHEANVGFRFQPVKGSLYEREADRLLDGLGPRFIDWWRPNPLPVDADLLADVVPGFMPPHRQCPPNVRSKLTDEELTYLRKLAHPLPTHFVLGRNTKLQGLAAAILKLWEKCFIVKIALKWGAPNTNNEQMASQLKRLTGGVLLLRNKFYIVLYRGNNFLPCKVANLVAEREAELKEYQFHEENARVKAVETFCINDEPLVNPSNIGTLSDFYDMQTEYGNMHENRELHVRLEAEKKRLEEELRKQEHKLYILKVKIERSNEDLLKLNSGWRPSEQESDLEFITEEERECFQKIGIKMDSSLLLGRCGVFDGVIEGMHQHWKHREVVKVITMQRRISQVLFTAKSLERESGGILVSVDKLKEGHAIIIYRGKNYSRPHKLVHDNLLSKREALHRSLLMQRIGSLRFFAYQRQIMISDLKLKLAYRQEGSWGADKKESERS